MSDEGAGSAFEYQAYAQRVLFGAGAARDRLAGEVERLGAARVLLFVTSRRGDEHALAAELTSSLPVVATFDGVRPHVPIEIAEAARELARGSRADLLLSIGGGSTTGTAKAVAMTTGLPILAVPTTYAGSESTPVWGLTEAGRKTTGTDTAVLPRTVVYDPELTVSLPAELSIASGLNAMAHCVDSLWAPKANPVSSALAVAGVRALRQGLPDVRTDGRDVPARGRTQYGAYLAAVAFSGAGSGLHHKICHVLGGAYDLPHGGYFAIGTWVVAEVFKLLTSQVDALGGGSGLSLEAFRGTDRVARVATVYWLGLALAVLVVLATYLLMRSRLGLALTTIRDDPTAAASLGVAVRSNRRIVYVVSSAGAGLAGALLALSALRVTPDASYAVSYTAFMIFIVVIGGIGTIEGPLIGAVVFFVLQQQLAQLGSWYLVILGAVAVLVVLVAPKGLWGLFAARTGVRLFPVGYTAHGSGTKAGGRVKNAGLPDAT